jgi:hypothetical protein
MHISQLYQRSGVLSQTKPWRGFDQMSIRSFVGPMDFVALLADDEFVRPVS